MHFFSDGVGEKVGFVYIGTNKANMKLKYIGIWLLMLIFFPKLYAQSGVYHLRGSVLDAVSQQPLIGAHVSVSENPNLHAITDVMGEFVIENLSPGRYHIVASYLGYKETISLVEVTSGKEKIVTLSMTEDIHSLEEVVVTAQNDKQRPVNSMAYASTRTFSVEETNKFAGAVDDPARMVQSFAGVVPTNDGSNYVSVRGNHPSGLLYRLEGVDIPNPNHFGDAASSGGGVAVISSQLLSNSDFSTGAFSAEYGNAIGGIFDIKLRKGNNQKREWTVKAGFLGLEAAAEGPISKKHKSSYLINYRYSTLSLIDKLGVKLSGVLDYSDLSYNVVFPLKNNAQLSFFGVNGWSSQLIEEDTADVAFEALSHRYSAKFISNVYTNGLKYQRSLGRGFLSAILVNGITQSGYKEETNTSFTDRNYFNKFDTQNEVSKWSLAIAYTQKISPSWVIKVGAYADRLSYNFRYDEYQNAENFTNLINNNDHTSMLRSYVQASYSISQKWSAQLGAHYTRFVLNDQQVAEPRLSLKYQPTATASVSLSYGKHSQIQPLMVYFLKTTDGSDRWLNHDLEMTRSNHWVLTIEKQLNENTRLVAEAYYQQLNHIPTGLDENSRYAIVNQQFFFPDFALVNDGKGQNKGVELTLERFLNKGLYFIISGSISESKFKTPTMSWTNTRFNTQNSLLLTLGKEWKVGKDSRNVLGVNIKNVWVGGQWDTPVDLQASRAAGKEVRLENEAFTIKLKDFYKLDVGFKYKINKANRTATWSLDFMNATNHENIGGVYYDVFHNEVRNWTMMPLVPVLSYKLDF